MEDQSKMADEGEEEAQHYEINVESNKTNSKKQFLDFNL